MLNKIDNTLELLLSMKGRKVLWYYDHVLKSDRGNLEQDIIMVYMSEEFSKVKHKDEYMISDCIGLWINEAAWLIQDRAVERCVDQVADPPL